MDASTKVNAEWDRIVSECDSRGRPTGLSRTDRLIYYVVATRCEKDMNGFESVFDQLLTQSELTAFIEMLRIDLDEAELAALFQTACLRLDSVGFFSNDNLRVFELADAETEIGFIEDIDDQVGDRLWALDDKIAKLVSSSIR